MSNYIIIRVELLTVDGEDQLWCPPPAPELGVSWEFKGWWWQRWRDDPAWPHGVFEVKNG